MTVTFDKAFKNRSVLVTGHTGFKGAWLCLWLTHLGARVTGYSLPPPTRPSLFDLARLKDKVDHHTGDVRDCGALRRVVMRARPDFIFHLAAQSLVRMSYQAPLETFQTNVMGTANLLAVLKEWKRPCVVVAVTSDKCYQNREIASGYRETDPMGGNDPYSASKGCAELVAACWRKSFFSGDGKVRLATARAGNVIGGGDWASDRIVPDCIRALCRNRPIMVRNPPAVRPWQHVLEPLGGYLTLAARMSSRNGGDFCSAWNFGPGNRNKKTVRLLVEETIAHWGRGTWKKAVTGSSPAPEAVLLALNSDKARRQLGWRPAWGFSKTVRETVTWYKAWHEGDRDLQRLCLDQIQAFGKSAPRA